MAEKPLPGEIYREIFNHLHHYDNRNTLIASAQCSRLLRAESQRILFHTVFLDLWDLVDLVGDVSTRLHRLFLHAILDAPERLGPLVHSYSQYRVSCDSEAVEQAYGHDDEPDTQMWPDQRTHVFGLTARALYHMPNLKEFRFMPCFGHTHANLFSRQSSYNPGYKYPFQLEVLQWRFTGDAREAAFIGAQQSLGHISVESWRFEASPDGSQEGLQHRISPVLCSIVGALGEFCVLSAGREIVALEYWMYQQQDLKLLRLPGVSRPQDALARLRYIRLRDYVSFKLLAARRHAPDSYDIQLMEIKYWSPEEVFEYHQLPASLRVLVLGNPEDLTHADAEGRKSVALQIFAVVPGLRYLYICFRKRGVIRDAWRFTLKSRRGNLDDVVDDVVSWRDASGDDWWREHRDVLDSIAQSESPASE